MKKILTVISVFIFALSVSLAWAEESKQIEKFTLDNGMTVLVSNVPSSPSVGLYALVKTGSATEGPYLGTGISHFVEHMLFKGTEKRGVGEIGKEIKALGGIINASTSFDYTIYIIELPKEHFAKGLDVLADMLMNSKIDPEEVESERDVIFGEVRLHNDRPSSRLSKLLLANAYVRHPYQHPIIGYVELLDSITREDLYDYYKTHYIPNNIVFSVGGDLNPDEIVPMIAEKFKSFKFQPYLMRNLPQEPDQVGEKYAELEYPTKLARFSMAYKSVSLMDEDLYALDVLALILGRGGSSRLYKSVFHDQRLVHGIGSSNYTPMDKGLFEVEASLERENIVKAIAAVKAEIEKIKKKGVMPDELTKVKRQAVSRNIFSRETASSIAYQAAVDEAFSGDFDFSNTYVAGIKRVTNDDVIRVAKKYLIDTNLTTAVIVPPSEADEEKKNSRKDQELAIEKIVLDNGLTVLLRENPAVPLTAIYLMLEGGTRQEPPEKNGLCNLTARLWARETKSMSHTELVEAVESMGASFGPTSGRNSFGLKMNLLSEDLKEGFDIIEDVIKNPAFSRKEFDSEITQVQAEIKSQDDNVFSLASKEMRGLLFGDHYFKLEPLGEAETVANITREDVVEFYRKHVVPNNMVISVYGDFNRSEVLEILNKKFGSLKPKELTVNAQDAAALTDTLEKEITIEKEQAVVLFGYQGPKFQDDDRFALQVVNSILGSSLSGRMFNKIRDELGQAYTLGAGFVPGIDVGMNYFYVNTTPDNAAKVKEILLDLINEVVNTDVSDEELENSKKYIRGTFDMGLETNAALAFMTTLDELYGLGYNSYQSYSDRIDEVSKEDIKRVAKKYLNPGSAAIIIALPEKEKTDSENGKGKQ